MTWVKIALVAGGSVSLATIVALSVALATSQSAPNNTDTRPTPTSSWTPPSPSTTNSGESSIPQAPSGEQNSNPAPNPRPSRDAGASAQLEQLRAECLARNVSRDSQGVGIINEIQRLESSLPSLESELSAVNSVINSPSYWDYDFVTREQLSREKFNLEASIITTRGDIDYQYSELNLLATAYENCTY